MILRCTLRYVLPYSSCVIKYKYCVHVQKYTYMCIYGSIDLTQRNENARSYSKKFNTFYLSFPQKNDEIILHIGRYTEKKGEEEEAEKKKQDEEEEVKDQFALVLVNYNVSFTFEPQILIRTNF